jgi:hypothetical protein
MAIYQSMQRVRFSSADKRAAPNLDGSAKS